VLIDLTTIYKGSMSDLGAT